MRPRFGTSESSRHVRVTVVDDDENKPERSLRPDGSKPGSPPERWDAAYGRSSPGLGWLCFGILVLWRPLELISPYIPTILFKTVASLVLALLAYKLLTFRRWADETAHVRRFAVCFGVLVVELLVENFFVWVVSALDERKYDYTSLQDNLDRLLRPAEAQYGPLRAFLRYKAANAASLLLILLAIPFSVLWDQIPYSGFGLMSRAVLTMAASRSVRVVCFMLTVLPSPRPGCYARRFPPVPQSWWGFLRVGIGTLKGFGGCNDLIISGHGGVWIMPALVLQEYYPRSRLSWMLVAVYAHNSVRTVLERQHYSVDMLLAALVTAAVWRELRFLYHPRDSRLRLHRPPGTPADPVHPAVLAFIAIILLIVAIIVIVGGA